MKNFATIIAFIVLGFSTEGCSQSNSSFFGNKTVKASNNYVTKSIKMDSFTKLNVTGSPDVIYIQKPGKPEVEIYTSDNIIELLDIYVKNNTLYVGFKKGTNVSYKKLKICVSNELLNGISIAGSGNIELDNGLKSDDLKISISGSGDMKGNNISCTNIDMSVAGSGDIDSSNITCSNLKVSVAGSGDIKLDNLTTTFTDASVAGSGTTTLSGKTEEANYNVAGSGDLFASGLQAKKVYASVAGSGDIECHATDYLKARTSGSGSVGYTGNPELDHSKKGVHKL